MLRYHLILGARMFCSLKISFRSFIVILCKIDISEITVAAACVRNKIEDPFMV